MDEPASNQRSDNTSIGGQAQSDEIIQNKNINCFGLNLYKLQDQGNELIDGHQILIIEVIYLFLVWFMGKLEIIILLCMIFIEDKSKRNEDWLQYITHQINSDNNDNTK